VTWHDKEWFIYTFIKTDNTAADLYILNIIINWITINVMENSPSYDSNSCSGNHSILCFLQNLQVHCYFHPSLTHIFSSNSFSPPIFCSHIYRVAQKNVYTLWHEKAKLIWQTFLNFGFNVGVWSGHHRHPNTVKTAELLQECIHFFGPLCILHWTISLLQTICLVHFKRHADTTKWEIKKVRHWQSMANMT